MKLKIYFENNQEKEPLTYKMKMLIRKAILATLDYEKVEEDCEVSITFCDDEKIRELNRKFRNIDRATDVLSFPLFDEDCIDSIVPEIDCMLGDIVISIERAKEQAKELGNTFLYEVAFLVIHSTLHLLGYDHEKSKEDDELQCRLQREIISKIEI